MQKIMLGLVQVVSVAGVAYCALIVAKVLCLLLLCVQAGGR